MSVLEAHRVNASDRVLSELEAADLLGISHDTLRRMHQRGEGPRRLKISERRVGYRVSDIHRWLDQREMKV
jgi:predicted DNA-binding transcriptional regulator AlpA